MKNDFPGGSFVRRILQMSSLIKPTAFGNNFKILAMTDPPVVFKRGDRFVNLEENSKRSALTPDGYPLSLTSMVDGSSSKGRPSTAAGEPFKGLMWISEPWG